MIKTPYKSVGSRDLTGGMSDALSNTFQMLSTVEKEKLDKQRLDLQDARQARLDALNTPGSAEWLAAQKAQQEMKVSGLDAEQAWKSANDPVYQNALAAAKRETPGTPEWTAAQNALRTMKLESMTEEQKWKMKNDPAYQAQINALNLAESDRKGKEYLAKEIMGLPTETVVKTEITPEQREAARVGLESAAVVNAGDVYNREFAKLRTPVTVSEPVLVEGYEVTPGKTAVMSEEEAHQEALKRAGLLDVVAGKAPVIDERRLPKVGVTESKKKLTADELTQAKLNATVKAAQEGKVPAAVALEVATKLTPTKTQKEKLEEAKLALDIEEFKEKQAKGYYGKGGGSGSGDWLKTLNETYKTYGDPDVIGTGDRARIQNDLAKIQVEGKYSDADMKNAIEASMGVYANPGGIGVDNLGFVRAVGDNLLKMKNK